MLSPAIAHALAIAHIEDLHRAGARSRMIRLARRVAPEPGVAVTPNGIKELAGGRPDLMRHRRRPDGGIESDAELDAGPRRGSRASRRRSRLPERVG